MGRWQLLRLVLRKKLYQGGFFGAIFAKGRKQTVSRQIVGTPPENAPTKC